MQVPTPWDLSQADAWWPWPPAMPDRQHALQDGDYVEIQGALYQDNKHRDETSDCWEGGIPFVDPVTGETRGFVGHAGTLEIHPPDSITYLASEQRPRSYPSAGEMSQNQNTMVYPFSLCDWGEKRSEVRIYPPVQGGTPGDFQVSGFPYPRRLHTGQTAHVEFLVDSRFTDTATVVSTSAVARDEYAQVSVAVRGTTFPPRPGKFKGTAIVTWDRPSPPGQPDLAATPVSGSAIELRWTLRDPGADTIRVERSLNGTDFSIIAPSLQAEAGSWVDGGLAAATRYYYRIQAHNQTGDSAYSIIRDATTFEAPCYPTTCEAQSVSCGYIPDGCGLTLNCGFCPIDYDCLAGMCVYHEPQLCCDSCGCHRCTDPCPIEP